MKLRYQYLIAGIAWALLMGLAAALLLFGFAAGASWLWLFGDDPWPEATRWTLPLIGVIGGAIAALTCIIVAYSYGPAQEALLPTNARTERRKVLLFTATPLTILVVFGLNVWRESREYVHDMEIAAQREAAFTSLSGAAHRITAVTLDQDADDRFRATVRIKGERAGEYGLHWQVTDNGFKTTLAAGNEVVRLQAGESETEIVFTLDELARNYRAKLLQGRGGVLVEEPFRVEVSLTPLFTDTEREALPPGERRRLDAGDSPLRFEKSTEFPVRFFIGPDGHIER